MCICKVCGKKADKSVVENWVQCDECELWFHFACAGVDESVQHRDWSCASCVKETNITGPGHTSTMQQTNASADSSSEATQSEPVAQQCAQSIDIVLQDNLLQVGEHLPSQCRSSEGNRQHQLMMAMLEEKRAAEERFIEQKYQLLAQMNTAGTSVPITQITASSAPSPSQIAARQAIPKELPIFSGDPEEWPMFISTFEHSTSIAGFSNVENMLRLQRCLKGKARELVKDKLLLPTMVPDVLNTLKMFFGRPEHILERMITKARKIPPPKERLESLIEFALAVRNICATMQTCKLEQHLNNPMLVKELVDKLPNQHKLAWAMYPRDGSPSIQQFSNWLYRIAEAASTVVSPAVIYKTSSVNTHSSSNSVQARNDIRRGQNCSHAENRSLLQSKQYTVKCVACGTTDHYVALCPTFRDLSANERWQMVKKEKACYRCLKSHRKGCFSKKTCGVNGCSKKHHPLLHSEGNEGTNKLENDQAVVSTHRADNTSSQYFRMIPVQLHAAGKTINIFAFLDEGSSVTLIDGSTFKKLGIKGVPSPICLQWTSETTRNESTSVRASVQISAPHSNKLFWLNNVHTVQNLALPKQSMKASELRSSYPYLRDIPLPSYDDIQPTLLIGADNWKIAVPRRIREGKRHEPIASKCLLGWSIQGTSTAATYVTMHHCECKWQELHDIVKESFSLESVKPQNLQSNDDKRAIEILDRTCIKVDGRFEVGLLWRDEDYSLPESYNNAVSRLNCLKNKIKREPELYGKIDNQIRNLIQKNYAVELSKTDMAINNKHIWYLPIFIAKNPNKPNKVRLVWDAAAKSHGTSLNDHLLTGPDLLQPLIEILLRFRVGEVAICADIAEMFHRINIRKEDMHAQRFLWYDQISGQTKAYVMCAMTFGINCGPCIAHYVRNKNAEQNRQKYPSAYEAIQNAHYVDDYIDSAENEEAAFAVADEVRSVHRAGGFEIRNWASNSPNVLRQLSNIDPAVQSPVQFSETEKVLGMYWEPYNDVFKYILRFARLRRDVLAEDVVPTKREVLQVLMSIFDPLGLVSCYTIGLKILLQRVWRVNIGWDEVLPEELIDGWLLWKRTLPLVEAIEIPRCYSKHLFSGTKVELHTFVDASEYAYAAVCYLRVLRGDLVDLSLVAAKSKVAPLKPVSIPRMELQAAVMGLRLAQRIINVRRLKIQNVTYWSDSRTVLQWLKMDPRNFQQFVMHRVGEILENSDSKQWRWVPTKLNVADAATKVNSSVQINEWLHGPDFLFMKSCNWPVFECKADDVDTTELRKHIYVMRKTPAITLNVEYFSDWRRLYRAVATFVLYIAKLKARVHGYSKPNKITPEMIRAAENILIKQAQFETYSSEVNSLHAGQSLGKQSRLSGLNAYLDDHGILRIQGRASSIDCHMDAIVMPRENHTTFLIVRAHHENFHHMAHETVINNVRSSYYIPRLRVLYKAVRHSCQKCKIHSAVPTPPQMVPIPAARLASFAKPFTYTGVDYFGPIFVNVGRHKEKRWVVLFTCLTLRAVHFEIAYSLDTSSCIMCLRNFMARRGTPREIYSDNGTNFKATEKLVREKLIEIDFDKISVKYDRIIWRFNPPSAPHMGGVWERLVRSAKTTLRSICPSYSFNDEGLRCALMEAEFIINSRPLTFVSLESIDDTALTPNHLLLGSADGYKPACSNDMDVRQRWRRVQLFGDSFWQRWVKEYTPVLTKRNKWFQKSTPLAVDDIVIVVDENLPRNLWPKGRVISTVIAKDGQSSEDTQTQLKKLHSEFTFSLEKIESRENHLNNELQSFVRQFKEISIELSNVQHAQTQVQTDTDALVEQLNSVLQENDIKKSEMERRGQSMSDGSSVVNIKKAISKLKEETAQLNLEVALLVHGIDQYILRQAGRFGEVDSGYGSATGEAT
ncbi:uncharacterized protein LOC118741829 [Rhagoletis pomonella]|uniref:uncharacterized protein LOC118741829 n=1 Tax=Rhagoletis pomonella TaxID=28610 RepID=UPI001783830B|nr:uncharacterized protein LOC118741829 [Rhagoletis pomonella]